MEGQFGLLCLPNDVERMVRPNAQGEYVFPVNEQDWKEAATLLSSVQVVHVPSQPSNVVAQLQTLHPIAYVHKNIASKNSSAISHSVQEGLCIMEQDAQDANISLPLANYENVSSFEHARKVLRQFEQNYEQVHCSLRAERV